MVRRKKVETPSNFSEFNVALVVLALILVAGGAYYYFSRNLNSGELNANRASGEFVSGFPKEYILESGIVPEESALITFPGDSNKLWNASYVSKLSPENIISSYESLFTFAGCEITQKTSSFIYARLGKTDVSAKVEVESGGTRVLVSILNK